MRLRSAIKGTPELLREGRLPARYAAGWDEEFDAYVGEALGHARVIVDVGAGASPTVAQRDRPADCDYIGVDISRAELARAAPGAYTRTYVCDVSRSDFELPEQADLILSWQVFEHLPSTKIALTNMYRLLAPGGEMVSLLSGSRAVFALVARALPQAINARILAFATESDPEDKFPTVYDECTYRGLSQLLGHPWCEGCVSPRYRGATYLAFAPALMALYLRYENFVARRNMAGLATHYVVRAKRPIES